MLLTGIWKSCEGDSERNGLFQITAWFCGLGELIYKAFEVEWNLLISVLRYIRVKKYYKRYI